MRQLEKVDTPFGDLVGMLDVRGLGRETAGKGCESLPKSWFDLMSIKEMKHSGKRFEITKEILETYLEIDPYSAEMLVGLAIVNYAQGDVEEAKDLLGRVLAYEPLNDDAHALLAFIDKGKDRA